MARAINQTIAWITALFLSLLVFGLGLAIVYSLHPKHKDDDGRMSGGDERGSSNREGHDEETTTSESKVDARGSEHDSRKSPEHPADVETRAKSEHGPTGEGGSSQSRIEHESEEKEITPASIRARSEGEGDEPPEAKPHH